MSTLVLPAPAKLNLFLRIVGQREDGYHELQTIMQYLDWFDTLTIEATSSRDIVIAMPQASIATSDNIIFKAAEALRVATGVRAGCHIQVDKQLPIGAGLGGGSSNAATTLLALNELWGCALSDEALAEIGVKLGADVPFFLGGNTAWAEGIGERLTPVDVPDMCYLVVVPGVSISTAQVFADDDLPRGRASLPFGQYPADEDDFNDCLDVVLRHYPEVRSAYEWLKDEHPVYLTGTGCALFVPMADETSARKLQESLPTAWHSKIARGLSHSPLHEALFSI